MNETWIFNDWQTWEAWRDSGQAAPRGVVYTDHPYLYEKLTREGFAVTAAASWIDSAAERDLALFCGKLVTAWRGALDTLSAELRLPVKMGAAVGRPFFSFVNSLFFRAAELSRILERHETAIVPFLADDERNLPDAAVKNLNPFNCNYHALLAQAAKGGGPFVSARAVEVSDSLEAVSRRHNSGENPLSRVQYLRLLALRLFAQNNLPAMKWRFGVFCRFPSDRSAGRIWIYLPSPFIERTLPSLVRAGFSVDDLRLPAKSPQAEAVFVAADVERVLFAAYEKMNDGRSPARDAAAAFAARRASLYVAVRLAPAALDMRRRVDTWLSRIGAGGNLVFSNGLCEPEEAVLEQALKGAGVPLIAFEHGVIGLTRVDETVGACTDRELCGAYVVHCPWEIDFHARRGRGGDKPMFVNGIADLTAPASRAISRRAGRGFLGQARGRKLVVYAPTRFREDNVWIGCETSDVDYWLFMKEMIFSAFAACDGNVFIKLHQKGWLPGQKAAYDLRKHPLEIAELPANVSYGTVPQLNYLRWAADVIVIDRATSTIQWALTREIPMIYVDCPANPLNDEIREDMSRSVFLVDGAKPSWSVELKELLNLPVRELKARWRDKNDARENLLSTCVWGPRFDGKKFTRWVKDLVPGGFAS